MRIIGHLLATAVRTFTHIIFSALICAVLFGGAALIAAYASTRQWPPSHLTELLAAALAVVAAYAGAVTALMRASARALMDAARVAEHEAVAPLRAAAHELEGAKS